MSESAFAELCGQLAGNLWLQGLLIAAGVCFLEDIGRCSVGLLVASGRVGWWFAFSWMMIGSMIGDLALYLIGRYAMDFCVSRGWIRRESVEKTELYFSRHAFKAIVGARFLPGARTVAYTTAGATRYRIPAFLGVLAGVTVVQTLFYLYATDLLGDRVLAYLADSRTRWMIVAVVLVALVCGHFIFRGLGRRRVLKEVDPPL